MNEGENTKEWMVCIGGIPVNKSFIVWNHKCLTKQPTTKMVKK